MVVKLKTTNRGKESEVEAKKYKTRLLMCSYNSGSISCGKPKDPNPPDQLPHLPMPEPEVIPMDDSVRVLQLTISEKVQYIT